MSTQVITTEQVSESPLVFSAEGGATQPAAEPNSDGQLKIPAPSALTAAEALELSATWKELVEQIEVQIDPVYKYPLQVIGYSTQGQKELPTAIDAYADTAYKRGQGPLKVLEGHSVYGPVSFRYDIRGAQARHVGKLDCIVLDSSDRVVEVWARSEETLRIFEENIHGRTVTREELERLYTLNEQLIEALREDQNCSTKLRHFITSKDDGRGYPDLQWSDHAKLAYYDCKQFDIKRWAEDRGFSEAELFQAGFLERTVTETEVRYSEQPQEAVFIPFKDDDGRIVLWRRRVVHPKGGPKYLSAPLRREHRYPESVHRELYQSEMLKDVAGRHLIITEGELKCLVTTQLTGFATVGITGITQVTDLIIQKIVQSKPDKITVILDRDPLAMGLARTDRLTDSERAAFMIATRLKRAEHPNVFIGTVPPLPCKDPTDPKAAQKVGLDDYLLAIKNDHRCPTTALKDILRDSKDPDAWLSGRGDDPLLQEVLARIQRLGQLDRHFRSHVNRSGKYLIDSPRRCEADAALNEISGMVEMLKAARDRHLRELYGGSRKVNQPPRTFAVLYATKQNQPKDSLCLVTQDRRVIPLDASFFQQDIPSLRAVPPDLPGKRREPKGEDFPFSMAKLTLAYEHPKQKPDIMISYNRGVAILLPESGTKHFDRKAVTYEQFVRRVFAGWLASSYPTTQFHYEEGVTLQRLHPTYSEIIATIPIAIFKDGHKPVQFCFLPVWNTHQYSERSGAVETLSSEDIQKAVATDAVLAGLKIAHEMAAVRCGVRDPKLSRQLDKLADIARIIGELSGKEGREEAAKFLSTLGILPSIAQQIGAMYLSEQHQGALVAQLRAKGLVNQACQSGLLWIPTEGEFAEARFTDGIILLPELGDAGRCIGYSVLPTSSRDWMLKRLPPVPKIIHPLDSVRSTTKAFTLTGKLFPRLAHETLKDKTVLIVPSELECLQLQSLVLDTAHDDILVLGIRELDSISSSEYQSLARSEPKRVVFVGSSAEHNTLARRYAPRALMDPEVHAAMYLRANQNNKTAPTVSAVSIRGDLAGVMIDLGKEPEATGTFLDDLLKSPAYEPNHRSLARLAFSELLADLERACTLRGADSEQPFPCDLEQATEILRALYGEAYIDGYSFEDFLEYRYMRPLEQPITQFAPAFKKPDYRPGATVMTEIPEPIVQECLGRAGMLEGFKARSEAHREGYAPSLNELTREVEAQRYSSEEPQPGSIHDTLQRLITKGVVVSQQPQHSAKRILGKLYHSVTISVVFAEQTLSATGCGPSKNYAQNQAVRYLYRSIREAPDLSTIYDDEVSSFKYQGEFERRLIERRCMTFLKQEVASLKSQGVLIEVAPGDRAKAQDKSGWIVPLSVTMGEEGQTFVYTGSTPDASLNMAAARAIVWLREMLDKKRGRGEHSEPTCVVRDLEDLVRLIKADLQKGKTEERDVDGMPRQQVEGMNTPAIADEQSGQASVSANAVNQPSRPKEQRGQKSTLFVCSWTLSINGDSVTETGTGTKKKVAERTVAAKLLRWLEQRDPVREILEWEKR